MTYSEQVAQALIDLRAFGYTPDQPITFKSGILSPVYIDNRILPFHPLQWRTVIMAFAQLIEHEQLAYDALAGIATAGIPHSSALAFHLQQPSLFIRKEAKGHGTQKRVEGGDVQGKHVLLVEDLVTMGGSSLDGVAVLREEGATVTDCLAIVTYGFEETAQRFADANVRLHVLLTFDELARYAVQVRYLPEGAVETIEAWRQNPHRWGR